MSRRYALSKPLIFHARSPGQRFAASFLQIPPCGEHFCLELWLLGPSPSEAFTPQTTIMPRAPENWAASVKRSGPGSVDRNAFVTPSELDYPISFVGLAFSGKLPK